MTRRRHAAAKVWALRFSRKRVMKHGEVVLKYARLVGWTRERQG